MTTDPKELAPKLERLQANIARIETLSQRLMAALANRKQSDSALNGPSSEVYTKAAAAYIAQMMQNPAQLMEHQISHWGKTLTQYMEAQQALLSGEFKSKSHENPVDKRFSNPLWDTNPAFHYIKQQYLLNSEAITSAMQDLPALDASDRKRVRYFTRQIVDMFAPTNFLGTNPDALERAIATDGESLVQGLENLVRDIEENQGDLIVTLADRTAFKVGQNIGTTPGKVVYRNRMFELLQYAPSTEKVCKIPILIFPPWINKFYIMDLKPQNSLIKWIVDQGYNVFVVSWVNPNAAYADVGMDDYIRDGFMRAISEVRSITGTPQINTIGYCIAGTALALTLAHMERAGDKSVKSATFFTTLTDFSDTGEVGVFLDDDFVDGIARQSARDGILNKVFMARTFSFLRSNDLIYQPAIRSYMMGEKPPAFDLLFWNGDGTNLPAKMAVEYLRGLCQQDGFAKGTFPVFGEAVSLGDVKIPLCAVACETDHIAAWKSSYNGIKQMGSKDKTFILAQSGHIAGIINPPSKGKYGYYSSPAKLTGAPEEWQAQAQFEKASWWPLWEAWLRKRSGAQIAARVPGAGGQPVLGDAPGIYVQPLSG